MKINGLPLVQPHFSDTSSVMQNNFGNAPGERVGRFITENMPNMRARYDFENTAALPNLNSIQLIDVVSLVSHNKIQF